MFPDGITSDPPVCICCDNLFNVEDVFPKWVRDVLPKTKSVRRVVSGSDRRPWRTNVLKATVTNAVDRHCNGGWMSRMEIAAKPVLSDLMNPKLDRMPIALGQNDQQIAAFWATQKALFLELSMRQEVENYNSASCLSLKHFKWMYTHREDREPPPGTQVWFFAYEAQKPGQEQGPIQGQQATHQSLVMADKSEQADTPQAFLSTFTIGMLGIQVLIRNLEIDSAIGEGIEPFPLLVPPSWLVPGLGPIWPTLDPVTDWLRSGRPALVTSDDLPEVVTWGPTFRPPAEGP